MKVILENGNFDIFNKIVSVMYLCFISKMLG